MTGNRAKHAQSYNWWKAMKAVSILFLAAALLLGQVLHSHAANGHLVSMTFEFVDACDDGYSPEIEFYLKENPSRYWGTFWLRYYNEPLTSKISCESGKEVCFGAWLKNQNWGCGKKCSEPGKGACFVCQEAVVSVGLGCK
jgi:hypothetical protein